MNLTQYDTENTYNKIVNECAITVRRKGNINFSVKLVKAMGITDKDRVLFHRNGGDWYISKTANTKGFKLRYLNKHRNNLMISSCELTREIFKSTSLNPDISVRFKVTPKPFMDKGMILYTVITSEPKIIK
jgi:hypothetical protein